MFQRHHWESNPRPSGLLRNALNKCATASPYHNVYEREICHACKDLSLVAQYNNPKMSVMSNQGVFCQLVDISHQRVGVCICPFRENAITVFDFSPTLISSLVLSEYLDLFCDQTVHFVIFLITSLSGHVGYEVCHHRASNKKEPASRSQIYKVYNQLREILGNKELKDYFFYVCTVHF